MHKLILRISKSPSAMFTLYLKTADISISFASSELSSASESKGGIFVIRAGLNLN